MTYLEFIATILIGYILGYIGHQETKYGGIIGAQIEELKKTYHRGMNRPKVGAVQTPSQQDIIRKENPKLAEEEDEMREAFKNLKVENGK